VTSVNYARLEPGVPRRGALLRQALDDRFIGWRADTQVRPYSDLDELFFFLGRRTELMEKV
jgi:hypothetical protein